MPISEPPSSAHPERTRRRARRMMLALLFSAGALNFLDRGSLSIANTVIRAELHLSGSRMGALLSFFSLAYGITQLPAGWLLDRIGARKLLGGGLLIWSAAQAATALVRSFGQFVPLRLVLGFGEAPFFASGVQAIEGWFGPKQRGLPTALLNVSTMFGQAIAPPVLTVLMLRAGWRAMFALIGGLGVVLALVWFPFFRDPPKAAGTIEPAGSLKDGATPAAERVGFLELLRSPVMWGMLLGLAGINYSSWLYLAWLPGYLEAARHVSIARTGLLAVAPLVMGACGMFTSGLLADALARRGGDPIGCRRWLVVGGLVVSAAFTFLVAGAGSTHAAVLLIGGALFCVHFAGTAAWGVPQFAAPPGRVGTVASLQNGGSYLLASAAPWITGVLLDTTHSFAIALSLCAALAVAGAVAYGILVRGPILTLK